MTVPVARARPIDAAMLEQLIDAIELKLAPAPNDLPLLRQRAALLRALGDISRARAAYDALRDHELHGDVTATRAAAILAGAPADWPDAAGPVPFVRIESFLAADQLAQLWRTVTAPDAEFFAGSVKGAQGERHNPDVRQAQVMRRAAPVKAWFMPLIEALGTDPAITARLGLAPFEIGLRELQVTRHDDGAYLWPHRDIGPAHPTRHISYVYYFHREPRRFEGGDLLLLDQDAGGARLGPAAFTRIVPAHNSLILFPSDRRHLVTRVTSASADLRDSRWTVNGWLNTVAPVSRYAAG